MKAVISVDCPASFSTRNPAALNPLGTLSSHNGTLNHRTWLQSSMGQCQLLILHANLDVKWNVAGQSRTLLPQWKAFSTRSTPVKIITMRIKTNRAETLEDCLYPGTIDCYYMGTICLDQRIDQTQQCKNSIFKNNQQIDRLLGESPLAVIATGPIRHKSIPTGYLESLTENSDMPRLYSLRY